MHVVKCTWAIFTLSDSAFIFIRAIDTANWYFGNLCKPIMYFFVINMSLCKHIGGGGCNMKRVLWSFGGAGVWIMSLNRVGGNIHFSNIFEKGMVMIYPWQQCMQKPVCVLCVNLPNVFTSPRPLLKFASWNKQQIEGSHRNTCWYFTEKCVLQFFLRCNRHNILW